MGIAFNRSYYGEEEIAAVKDALINQTDYLKKSKQQLRMHYPNAQLFLTSSATYALELILSNFYFKKGAEIILPSFNFPSAPNAVLRAGALPVFADIDPKTLTIDLDDVQKKITRRTAAVIPVHYGGVSCDMDGLMKLAKANRIAVIEDAALSFGGAYKKRPLGSIGDFGVLSFDGTKNLSCEKGGLAIVNHISERDLAVLTQFYNNGTDRQAFLEGKVANYSWKQIGMNVVMSNLSAAVLDAQLKKADEIFKKRQAIYHIYYEGLKPYTRQYRFRIPEIPKANKDNAHVFYLVFESEKTRERVRLSLENQGIHAHTHYAPLHLASMGKRLGYRAGDLPVTERVAQCQLRLPLHGHISHIEAGMVVAKVLEAL